MKRELIFLGVVSIIAMSGLAYLMQASATGQSVKYQYYGKYTYVWSTPEEVCRKTLACKDGLPGIPTGRIDPFTKLIECKCQTYPHTGWFDRVRKLG